MEEHRCAFSAPLITRQFGCTHAREVTRRGGPDIACVASAAAAQCEALFQRLKAAALPAFGVEDDLLSMPHSVQVKIQCGGLLGLQRLLGNAPQVERVEDVAALVAGTQVRFGEAPPVDQVVGDMTGFKPRARRGR